MASPDAWIRLTTDGIEIRVKVVPGASRARIAGLLGDELKIQTTVAPEKGRANKAVLALIAARLDLPVNSVTILRGHASPHKVLHIHGISADSAIARLLHLR